jgi:hypothetical protein
VLAAETLILTIHGPRPLSELTEPVLVYTVDPHTNEPRVHWCQVGEEATCRGVVVTYDSGLEVVASEWHEWVDELGRFRSLAFLKPRDRVGALSVNIDSKGPQLRIRKGGSLFRCTRLVAEAVGMDIEGKHVLCKDGNFTNLDPSNLEALLLKDKPAQKAFAAGHNRYISTNHIVTSVGYCSPRRMLQAEIETGTVIAADPKGIYRRSWGSGVVVAASGT